MKQSVKIMFYCAGLTALTSTIAIACNIEFPWQLLDNRQQTLINLPATDSFSQKVKALGFVSPEERKNFLATQNTNTANSDQQTCPNTDEVYQKAATLFHHKQWDEAYSAFAMLAYNSNPAQQVCAKYTLGRIEKELGHFEDAVQSFNGVAYLVAHGAPDPLGLGIAAYGQAAGVTLDQIGTRSTDKDGMVTWQVGSIKEDSLLQLQRATELYLKQAALNNVDGLNSVMVILRGLTNPNNENAKILLDQAVRNPLLRKILLAYVLTDEINYSTYSKAQTQNILNAFIKASPEQTDHDMGSLAAFAYQNNDMEKAQTFAEYDWKKNQHALDAWILAKIALRKGNKEKAQEYYHEAIAHFNDRTLENSSKQRIQGERAVLILSQGNFVQALEALWPVRDIYWGDVVYLSENVLTPDELKNFVNTHTKPPHDPKNTCNPDFEEEYTLQGRSLALRHLLARRLMRINRLEEAVPYFANPGDLACKGWPKHVKIEKAYIKATKDMRQSFWATDRAKAAWKAATILRDYGMQLMGTDGYPDQNPGNLPYGISQIRGPVHDPNNKKWSVPDEQIRTGVSWPIPNRRFHYRYVAVENILYATRLIPQKSQAYAAMLCHANGWMQNTSYRQSVSLGQDTNSYSSSLGTVDDSQFAYAKSKELYNLYLKNGASVSFAQNFGYNCPEPQFDTIPKLKRDLFWNNIKESLRFLKNY